MATTRLSDVIEPQVYLDYTAVNSPEKTAFWESGVVVRNAMMDAKAKSGGRTVHMPFWRDLDATVAPNLSTDNPADVAVPNKISAADHNARLAYLNQGWSDADLTGEIAGANPMRRIRDRTDTYWTRQWQRRLIAAARGVLADNIANDSGDMVKAIDGIFTRSGFTSALFTMGDRAGELSTMAVHSAVMQQMVDAEDVEYVHTPSEGMAPIPFYMGKRLVVDDSMPAVATTGATGSIRYTSVLFGPAAFGFGVGEPEVPVEVEREAAQGNGGGVETLWERKTWLLHPFGFNFTSSSVAGVSPTIAELATAANWDRVVERKNIPMAFLTSTLIAFTP